MAVSAGEGRRRYVVVHEDDIGVSHGSNTAFLELSRLGICTAGSVMVPCPWFPELAAMARENPDLDIGVHLTLNAEMPPYRWRPLTGVSKNGLTDPDGYFWKDVPEVRRYADPVAVEAELRAQVDAALAAGIDVTHLDCHMGTAMTPEFVEIYRRLGADYNLPLLLIKDFMTYSALEYSGEVTTAAYDKVMTTAAAAGNPVFDRQLETPWAWPDGVEAAYRDLFGRIPEGLTFLSLHFNAPGEIEIIASEANIRTGEYAFFKTAQAREMMNEFGLTPIGMRDFRDRMRDR